MESKAANEFEVRRVAAEDVPAAMALVDECFGRGFGHADPEAAEVTLLACTDPWVIGLATVALRSPADLEAEYACRVSWPDYAAEGGPIALVSQIAVDPSWHGRGVGDVLMNAIEQDVSVASVGFSVANAWVHARTGICPASRLLERNGYRAAGFVPDFFAGSQCSDPCPGCQAKPCVCGVRVYFKQLLPQGSS